MTSREQCRSIVRHLWAHLDGALPSDIEERVVQHLQDCTTCRSHFEFERTLLTAIRMYGGMSSDVDFEPLRRRVVRALAREEIPRYEVERS